MAIEWTVSVGNLITLAAFVISYFGSLYRLMRRLDRMELVVKLTAQAVEAKLQVNVGAREL